MLNINECSAPVRSPGACLPHRNHTHRNHTHLSGWFYSITLILFSQFSSSASTLTSFVPSITNNCPSLSEPPLVVKPSGIVLLGHNSFTLSKLLPMPYPPFVLNGITVLF